jgi:hypothetical protein
MVERFGCDEAADLLLDVATGAATGADRDQVLQHADSCVFCRTDLADLATVADGLLPLVPHHEPPDGFTETVLSRIASAERPIPLERARPIPVGRARRRRLPKVLAYAAALLLVAGLGGGLVWWRTGTDRSIAADYRGALTAGNGKYIRAGQVVSDAGAQVGRVFAYQGDPSWLLLTVTAAPRDGTYSVRMYTKAGSVAEVGQCVVVGGACTLGVTIGAVNASEIRSVRLECPVGTRLTASFTEPPAR